MTNRVENYLERKLKTRVEIGRISFGLSGNLSLESVYVEDRNKDTLLYGGLVKARLSYLKLFSCEVRVKSLLFSDITGAFHRNKGDSVFNYQFIIDAFAPAGPSADTAKAVLAADIAAIRISNTRLVYRDAVSGSDMQIRVGELLTELHSEDFYKNDFEIPVFAGKDIDIDVKQVKPLADPDPVTEDIAEAAEAIPLQLDLGGLDLQNVNVRYDNDVSALHANIMVGTLRAKPELIDLPQRKIYLSDLDFANSSVIVRMDKKEQAAILVKEVKQELVAQQQAGWDIRANRVELEGNTLQFDNNMEAKQNYGIDFAHLLAKDLSLSINDLVYNKDSIGGKVKHGSLIEKSGFVLEELKGDLLYAHNQAFATGLLIKTPGTEIKQGAGLQYASRDELAEHFDRTILEADIDDSYVQVKDILYFAPGLRRQKAFADPNATWELDLNGKGTAGRMIIDNIYFRGLSNTRIDASGTITGLSDIRQAGGDFRIRQLHTTQADISLFTGSRLSTKDLRIPENISLNGTLSGNSGNIKTNLDVRTTAGAATINGAFGHIGDANRVSYDATISTTALDLGYLLQEPEQFGTITGNFTVRGKGTKKENADAVFTGTVRQLGYNRYTYRDLKLDGSIARSSFTLHTDINDPNADADLVIKGELSGNSFYEINGMVDSLKTQPLHLTKGPLIARGKIDGRISGITKDNIEADILVSKGLFVSGPNRLPLDTIQIKSGRNDSVNYITFNSDIANARISGQYRLAELGPIIESSTRPYFSMGGQASGNAMAPYAVRFNLGVSYSPVLSSLVPGLVSFNTISAEGSIVSGQGINAMLLAPSLVYQGNEFSQLMVRAATADSGLHITANAASIRSGSGMALYNTRLDAAALQNDLRFSAATDDPMGRTKYRMAGLLRSSPGGNYSISLDPNDLLLNYEVWNIAAGNKIMIGPDSFTASNFVLQKDNQRLSIENADIRAGSSAVKFSQFRLATITAFLKNDSLAVDGILNGDLVVSNLMKTPSFTGRLRVDDLSMQKDTIGTVDLQVIAGSGNQHKTTATLTGRGNDVTMTGYFIPGKDITTDLIVTIRQLQLSTMEGALAKVMTGASGSLNGTARIKGRLSDPDITGEIGFANASFIPTALGTRFRIGDQKLALSDKGIVFDQFMIQDSAGNRLLLNGRALTSNFINYELALDIKADNFQVLNSVKGPGKIYYGKLNVSADIRVRGTEVRPRADGRIVVNEGTDLSFVVPQVDQGVAQRNGIVEFVDMDAPENDSLFLAAYDSLNNSGLLGFDVTTTIEVRKEAVFNVVIDEANGDLLNVQGEAQLSAGIDPSGKITLGGSYALEKGSYEISFNFLRRRFDIMKGSSITWTGEPTAAKLNIRAVYIANTAPLDLVSSQLSAQTNRNIYLQKLPFEVGLDLTGELLKPVIAFDINLPERNYGVSNDIVTAVQSKLSMMRQDEGEINKQVFSLLLLNRFVGENPFQSGTDAFSFNSYARQSVSKLLTEQLNQLAAGLVSGVDINFDVVSTDDYTTGTRQSRTDLNIGLSKQLLGNRLKITVGSNFQLEGPQNNNQQGNNIAGNVAADYQVSKDGRYVLRFYRQNEYQGIVDGYIIETGVSFIFSVDYDRFMQIFRKKKRPAQAAQTVNGL